MFENLLTGHELLFSINLLICIFAGLVIGVEREMKGKDAGVRTHILVIIGAMLFTMLSNFVDPLSTSRIAANIVVGIGFLGAGLILKGKGDKIKNLTTAASIWFSAAIGMAIGYGYQVIAIITTIVGVLIIHINFFKK